jgi:glyoxylase-like metal-dependent hydrolase (beta-lactamase superfamily II)
LYNFNSKIIRIDDVFRIKIDVPFAVKYVCLYLFDVDDQKVLIDAGLNIGNWSKVFLSTLKEIGFTFQDINYCLITHIHLDHIGLVRSLKRRNKNIKIIMNDITHQILEWETKKENSSELLQQAERVAKYMIKNGLTHDDGKKIVQFFTLWPKFLRYQKPDMIVHDGDTILNDLEVIWTPGHSFGHICVFNRRKRYLFAGDHILSRITPHIGNFTIPTTLYEKYAGYNFENILQHYLKSLDRIDKLNAEIIFPAHQEIIFNPHERILAIKEHHKNRLLEISNIIKNNPMTPFEISQIHFGRDLDEINSYMALSEVLGHLIYLENEGKVQKVEKSKKFYYKS